MAGLSETLFHHNTAHIPEYDGIIALHISVLSVGYAASHGK
jgi:hypothetical protein